MKNLLEKMLGFSLLSALIISSTACVGANVTDNSDATTSSSISTTVQTVQSESSTQQTTESSTTTMTDDETSEASTPESSEETTSSQSSNLASETTAESKPSENFEPLDEQELLDRLATFERGSAGASLKLTLLAADYLNTFATTEKSPEELSSAIKTKFDNLEASVQEVIQLNWLDLQPLMQKVVDEDPEVQGLIESSGAKVIDLNQAPIVQDFIDAVHAILAKKALDLDVFLKDLVDFPRGTAGSSLKLTVLGVDLINGLVNTSETAEQVAEQGKTAFAKFNDEEKEMIRLNWADLSGLLEKIINNTDEAKGLIESSGAKLEENRANLDLQDYVAKLGDALK